MNLVTTDWVAIAKNDLEAARDQLQKHAIYTLFPNLLDQNYGPALKRAQDVKCVGDYEKVMQLLILEEKVDFLRLNFISGRIATPAGIETPKVPGMVSVQIDANTATLKFPHFLRSHTEEWKQLEEMLGEVRKKERVVIDLSEYSTGATAVAMEVFGKLFGNNYWAALYGLSRGKREIVWRASLENAKSLEESDRSNLPPHLQKYFADVIAKMKEGKDDYMETVEPLWDPSAVTVKPEENLLQGKKIIVITNCARGVAREVSTALKTIPGAEHHFREDVRGPYFSDYRTVTLPSGTTLSFPRKLIP